VKKNILSKCIFVYFLFDEPFVKEDLDEDWKVILEWILGK